MIQLFNKCQKQVILINNRFMIIIVSLYSAPSAPVSNITSVTQTSTSLRLAWYPPHPERWNGVVIKYTVVYTLVETPESTEDISDSLQHSFSIPSFGQPLMNINDPVRVTLPLKTEMAHIEGLSEFSIYRCFVFLETGAGRSENSDAIEVMTLPDGRNFIL